MNNSTLVTLALAASVTLCASAGEAGDTPDAAPSIAAAARTRDIVDAATAFLKSLSAAQQAKVQFAFTPEKTATLARFQRTGGPGNPGSGPGGRPDGGRPEGNTQGPQGGPPQGAGGRPKRGPGGGSGMGPGGGFVGEQYGKAVWSNYPVSDVPRPGLQLGSLDAKQREAAMRLLRTLLSVKGYQKVLDVMESDQALHESGTPFASGKDVYTIGLFGTPSASLPWMLQFGGHHLALNIAMAGAQGVVTPTLTGAQPAVYTANGKTVRALAQENDKAFALLDALDETQRKQAILNYRVDDLVLGPGHAGDAIVPEGLKASAMNERQRTLLLDVISEWAGILNDAYAAPRMKEIKAGLNETYFAWSGPTTHQPGKNGSAYYRIQGPKLVIEFSPQGVGGDLTMHVHTIYRDPTNDYGRRLTAK